MLDKAHVELCSDLDMYVQALDTLGNTKWRVNKRILSVVESLWARGGNIAGLVDCADVSTLQNFLDSILY